VNTDIDRDGTQEIKAQVASIYGSIIRYLYTTVTKYSRCPSHIFADDTGALSRKAKRKKERKKIVPKALQFPQHDKQVHGQDPSQGI
jgi:hypothetical protein